MRIEVLQDTLIGGQWTGVGVGDFAPHIAEHLIAIGVARPYEAKVVEAIETKKSEAARPSSASQPDQVSPQPIATPRRGRPRKSSQ